MKIIITSALISLSGGRFHQSRSRKIALTPSMQNRLRLVLFTIGRKGSKCELTFLIREDERVKIELLSSENNSFLPAFVRQILPHAWFGGTAAASCIPSPSNPLVGEAGNVKSGQSEDGRLVCSTWQGNEFVPVIIIPICEQEDVNCAVD
jgi:hypothetical protein